jgi:hypothetical protein
MALKDLVIAADDVVMRVERLVIEAGSNTFTLDLNPKLTVVAGMGQLERESLIGELIGSLSGNRPGVHVEIEDGKGRHLAVFRPEGARHRIVDVDSAKDVSEEHEQSDGRLDLIGRLGLDTKTARRAMRLTPSDMSAASHTDESVGILAAADQTRLWTAADALRRSDDNLTSEAEAVGSGPEDAEIIDKIEERHLRFERSVEHHEKVRFYAVYVGGISMIGAIPASIRFGLLGIPFLLAAVITTLVAFAFRRRMENAQRLEEAALAEAGAQSYLGFHLQRVNGLLDNDQSRKRIMSAAGDRRQAMQAWQMVAGEIPVDWAIAHREEIQAASRLRRDVDALGSLSTTAPTIAKNVTAELAHVLVTRMSELRSVGRAGESLPLILDDPFQQVDPSVKPLLLELLSSGAGSPQIIFLTEDEDVASWARLEALTGDVSIVEPAPVHDDTDHTDRSLSF